MSLIPWFGHLGLPEPGTGLLWDGEGREDKEGQQTLGGLGDRGGPGLGRGMYT